jgi:hypothetical protein
VRDTEFFDLLREARWNDHEDLVAAFSRSLDEGLQWIEMARQARGTKEESHRLAILPVRARGVRVLE